MTEEKKPVQTPVEMIAKLAAMSDADFNIYMHWHFQQLCKKRLVSPAHSEDGK
jgi:hypothetical protein